MSTPGLATAQGPFPMETTYTWADAGERATRLTMMPRRFRRPRASARRRCRAAPSPRARSASRAGRRSRAGGYLWHLRFDRADATEVEVTFTPLTSGTRVRIEHRGWEPLGAVAEERRDRNRRGWAGVTEHYRRAAG